MAGVESVSFGVPVHAISNITGAGLDEVRAYLEPGVTAALLGSSGVGKSTLVNTLGGRGADSRPAKSATTARADTRRHAASSSSFPAAVS